MTDQGTDQLSLIKGSAPLSEMNYQFNLIVDVETNSYDSYPYYPIITIIKNKKQKLLAIKTIQTLTILAVNFSEKYDVHNNFFIKLQQVEQKAVIDLEENFYINSDICSAISIENTINSLFLNNLENNNLQEQQKETILLGLTNGNIINVDIENQKLVGNFSLFEIQENELDLYVTHLVSISKNRNSNDKFNKILAIFQDSTAVEYLVESFEINQEFLLQIKKQRPLITLNDKQKLPSLNSFTKKSFNNINYTAYNNFDERLNFFQMEFPQSQQLESNPQIFYKFSCNYITDISIQLNQFFQKKEKNIDKQLILAYTGLDGAFRIYDYPQLNPLFFYSTNSAAIHCFAFTASQEIVAIGSDDDIISLISLETQTCVHIISQKSTITKIIMLNECVQNLKYSDNLVILASSMDNSISITEIPKKQFSKNISIYQRNNNSFPMLYQNEIEAAQITPNNLFQLGQGGGIGNITIADNIMCISYLDGQAQIWEANFNSKKEDKVNLQNLSVLQQKVSMSILKKEKL